MGGGMDHGGETVFFVFSFTLSNRMRVINYQPSSPTARKYPRGVTRNNCKFPWAYTLSLSGAVAYPSGVQGVYISGVYRSP